MGGATRFLDIGCGTGQLVIEVAKRGGAAEGIDFSQSMIAHCEDNAVKAGVNATFRLASIFDVTIEEGAYDLVSAQGVIEYLSLDQLDTLFALCARMIKPGGALAIGSRNRLFNMFALNEYTKIEIEMGVAEALIREAIAFAGCRSGEAAVAAMREHERAYPQPSRHPMDVVEVETRYQFSPADLIFRLRKHGFSPTAIYPVNFHPLTPHLKADYPALHDYVARFFAETAPTDPRLVPFASTFVIGVAKNG